VKAVRSQLAEAEALRQELQSQNPMLGRPTPIVPPTGQVSSLPPEKNLSTANAEATALQEKIKVLLAQQDAVRAESAKVDELEGTLLELGRKKELDEANYRYFAAKLEQSRINEALGGSRISNIIEIQSPSPPLADRKNVNRAAAGLAVGGIAVGLAWAFIIELFIDRTIRRPRDIERDLKLPLFLTIPRLGKDPRRKSDDKLGQPRLLQLPAGDGPNRAELAVSDTSIGLQVFHETLRDRLISYFESRNLTHKPKLVAVTGLEQNAGVTTVAAGLARSLSETGEGNVLLVDMTAAQGSSMHFVQGKATCGLDELLVTRQNAHVHENLYVVAGGNNSDQLTRNMPQRFSKLVPKLKASDFDYIIFDMPAVSQISITPRLASFMDMVLLVVESEKTDRDVVQRSSELLARSRAPVGVVLNKTRSYVPGKQSHEFLGV
jgi:polysaccharide biosynthesis transport protein